MLLTAVTGVPVQVAEEGKADCFSSDLFGTEEGMTSQVEGKEQRPVGREHQTPAEPLGLGGLVFAGR